MVRVGGQLDVTDECWGPGPAGGQLLSRSLPIVGGLPCQCPVTTIGQAQVYIYIPHDLQNPYRKQDL